MPALLERIATLVESTSTGVEAVLEALPAQHAIERLAEGYDIAQAVSDLALVRDVVLDLFEDVSASVSVREVHALDKVMDQFLSRSVVQFASARERTLAALDRVTSAALGTAELDTFLPHLLSVVLETTASVDAASILLREGDRRRVRAASGLEAEAGSGFSLRIGEGFAGRIAQERQPMYVHDAETDPRVVGPVFKREHVHALYGVPLIHEGALVGVASMGSRTAYEFSPEDRQLFRSMARRATTIIVQAGLRDELRRAQAELEAIIDHAPAVITLKDLEGRYLLANRSMEAVLGVPRDMVLGAKADALFGAEEARRIAAADGEALRRREPMEPEETLELQDGVHTFLTVRFLVPDERGSPRALCAISTDITERKRMERERERIADAFERGDAAFLLDRDFRFVLVNQNQERLLGTRREETLGRNFWEVFPEAATPES